MPPTNGRGHLLLAVMCWRWADCGALQYLVRTTPSPDWVALVPASVPRPSWIPAHAASHLLGGDEVAYTWHDADAVRVA